MNTNVTARNLVMPLRVSAIIVRLIETKNVFTWNVINENSACYPSWATVSIKSPVWCAGKARLRLVFSHQASLAILYLCIVWCITTIGDVIKEDSENSPWWAIGSIKCPVWFAGKARLRLVFSHQASLAILYLCIAWCITTIGDVIKEDSENSPWWAIGSIKCPVWCAGKARLRLVFSHQASLAILYLCIVWCITTIGDVIKEDSENNPWWTFGPLKLAYAFLLKSSRCPLCEWLHLHQLRRSREWEWML
jgi:hypothetical protein